MVDGRGDEERCVETRGLAFVRAMLTGYSTVLATAEELNVAVAAYSCVLFIRPIVRGLIPVSILQASRPRIPDRDHQERR